MATDDVVQCGHPLCRCKVSIEDQFCSAACAAGTSGAVECACGHAECVSAERADEGDEFDSSAASA